MRVAIPVTDGKLSMHFGHCDRFTLFDVDLEKKETLSHTDLEAPPHQPGLLPRWLGEQGAELIIAGGMGQRAQALFAQQGIQVMLGVPECPVDRLIAGFIAGTLEGGENVCDH